VAYSKAQVIVILALSGGAGGKKHRLGALLGILLFHHKTRKFHILTLVVTGCVIHAAVIYIFTIL